MKKTAAYILALALAAAVAIPSMMAVKANRQKRDLAIALEKARAALQNTGESLDELGRQAQQARENALETVRQGEILKKMADENSGTLMLAAGIIGDLSSMVELQKTIIGRGTSPTIEEGEKLRQLEIAVLSAMKTLPIYTDRMKVLRDDMLTKR